MLRLVRPDDDTDHRDGPYPFPTNTDRAGRPLTSADLAEQWLGGFGPEPDDVLRAVDRASRRMEDLARELGCLGSFDDEDESDDDGPPRAA